MNFSIISKYRSQIMGFAILWIMIFHFYKIVNPNFMCFFTSLGYGGVDIFLLSSGLGLYYSWQKDNNIGHFYTKRILRVLPVFWFVVLGHDIVTKSISWATLSKLSTLGLWLPIPSTYWFISAIIAFYLLFPLYIKYYKKYNEKCLIVVSLIGVVLMSVYTIFNHSDTHRNDICFFFSRIPIFFIGVSMGKLSYNNYEMKQNHIVSLSVLSIVSLLVLYLSQQLFTYTFLQNTGLSNYPFIALAPALSVLLAFLFSYSSRLINQIMSFLGEISLELYLIHLQLIGFFKRYLSDITILGCLSKLLVFLAVSILLSWPLHIMIKRFLSLLKEKACFPS